VPLLLVADIAAAWCAAPPRPPSCGLIAGIGLLITIDIGASYPEDCGSRPDLAALASCAGQVPGDHHPIAAILSSLRAAAGPGVPVAGMS
jgi:hypothetical protein